MLEKEIEKRVCNYAKEKGMLVYKFTAPNRWAVPDRMFVTKEGTVFFIEFKQKGKKPTPAQEREINRLRNRDMYVAVVDNVSAGEGVIDERIAYDKHIADMAREL